MAWADAACHYEKAMQHMDDRNVALRAAEAYRQQNKLTKAIDWYAYADRMTATTAADALAYGRALQSMGRIGEAAKQFERLLAEKPEDAIVRELGMAIADNDSFYMDSSLYSVKEIPTPGLVSAFAAVPNGNSIFFAGEAQAQGKNTNPWNNASFLDLYQATRGEAGNWSMPQTIKGDVNARFHEGPCAFSADGATMYFTRSDYFKFRLNKDQNAVSHLMLFSATRQSGGGWGHIKSFAYNGSDFSAGHAALNATGDVLYYISDMPGGFGGTDIYACKKTVEGWGYPKNLGPTVNSAANEMFPTTKGDTLFFASNGHRTMGGLDIFYSVLKDEDWSDPKNMNYPLNTPFDDFCFTLLPDGRSGYLSSNRGGTDRIYTFNENEPTLTLEASFYDEESGSPMADVEVRMLDPIEAEPVIQVTNVDGQVTFPLQPGRDYHISASKDGVFAEGRDISTKGQRTDRIYREEFRMKRVEYDKPFIVDNIYYDYDKWDIRPDAALELDTLAMFMMENIDLNFELGSHTDSRASDQYNLVLSDMRAKSAVDYLIRRGVDQTRITARGYGEKLLG
ncbi:MAG TPA: OmpA family protein, partial [Flavobacteriales bacterium]|nr:OmpA family protein [Flavobacteriales bacterium]